MATMDNQCVIGLVVTISLLLLASSSLLLPYDEQATHLDWSSCKIREIPEFIQDMKIIVSLDLSNNLLEIIKPDILENNTRLEIINLSENPDLVVPEDGCFLINNSTKLLNASYIRNIDFKSSSLSCLPSLTDLILLVNHRCKQIRRILRMRYPQLRVSCKRGEYAQHNPVIKTQPPAITEPAYEKPILHKIFTSSVPPNEKSDEPVPWYYILLSVVLVLLLVALIFWKKIVSMFNNIFHRDRDHCAANGNQKGKNEHHLEADRIALNAPEPPEF